MDQKSTSTSQATRDTLPRTMADITPLEPPVDEFPTSSDRMEIDSKGTDKHETLATLQTHTPPETPVLPHVDSIAPNVGHDLPLFPDTPPRDHNRSPSPLLRSFEDKITFNQHDESGERFHPSAYGFHRHSEPTAYPSILGINTAQDALEYWGACVEEQRRWHRQLELPTPAKSAKGSRRDPTSTQQLSRLNRLSGVGKARSASPRPMPKAVAVATVTTPPPPPRKPSAPRKRVAKPKAASEGPSEGSQNQKKHTRAAPTKNVSTQKWTEIEDFTPPLSTLDNQSYEVKWDGQPKDISGEADLEHLHELEVKWASKLRLDPAQYLATKRLIFRERVAYLRADKTFTKTAAQGAARLDVNKLSRLHSAFQAVGWFDEKHFRRFLPDSPMQE